MYHIFIELNEEMDNQDGRVIITGLSTFGIDLEDCLSNAALHTEDWNGNETAQTWYLDDMDEERQTRYMRYISDELSQLGGALRE